MATAPELHVVPAAPAALDAARPPALAERRDEELMVASAAGRRDAFEILVARYLPRLISYCAKQTRDPRAAEELAQDTLFALWQARASYRPERALRVLVFTIAHNRCRNHARSWRRRLRWLGGASDPVELDAVPTGAPDHVDDLLARERQRRVRDALGRLADRDREVLLLRFEHELGYAEIAEVIGKREVTVRSQVFHALRKLERTLDEEIA
ncbi:MAG TPA: sigma-70 family RNA polymerase sigma factor [Kofleriaceae bacterium]|nr:sigma-70 family RNA polymerase sigma factor [Kofleriaceae bacterium]